MKMLENLIARLKFLPAPNAMYDPAAPSVPVFDWPNFADDPSGIPRD